jgi:RNA polymerase sigma factor (sigma-70 family)
MGAATNSAATGGDAELVSASLQGDHAAFGRIVGRYQSLVCSLAYSATGSLTQSEDLAQETFLEAWKHLASPREPEKLRSWLCGIARNRVRQSLRARQREPAHEAEALREGGVANRHLREACGGYRSLRGILSAIWTVTFLVRGRLSRIPYGEQVSSAVVSRGGLSAKWQKICFPACEC